MRTIYFRMNLILHGTIFGSFQIHVPMNSVVNGILIITNKNISTIRMIIHFLTRRELRGDGMAVPEADGRLFGLSCEF